MRAKTAHLLLTTSILILLISSSLAWTATSNSTTQKKEQGWKSLFDGKTLAGWAATGKSEGWAVEDGAIACTVKGGGYLYTQEQFENFTLSIDFKVDKGVNSGIFLRWSDLKDAVNTGIEIQVIDSYGKATPDKHDCGAIYDIIAPSKQACKAPGEWNTAVITCHRNQLSVEVNGQKVAEMNLDKWTTAGMNPDGTKNKFKFAYKELPRRGHIGLQDHGGRVWYRNIKIKLLG